MANAPIPKDILTEARRCYDALGRGSISDSEHMARALLARDKLATEREIAYVLDLQPAPAWGKDEAEWWATGQFDAQLAIRSAILSEQGDG